MDVKKDAIIPVVMAQAPGASPAPCQILVYAIKGWNSERPEGNGGSPAPLWGGRHERRGLFLRFRCRRGRRSNPGERLVELEVLSRRGIPAEVARHAGRPQRRPALLVLE